MENRQSLQAILSKVGPAEKARVARLWNYWNMTQDQFPKIWMWPGYLQEMMLKRHKDSRTRYRLFTFLAGNGLSPEMAVEMIQISDFANRQRVVEAYDVEAHREFNRFIVRSRTDPTFWPKASYYDLHTQRVERG